MHEEPRVLHGPAAPDWRGENTNEGRVSLFTKIEKGLQEAPPVYGALAVPFFPQWARFTGRHSSSRTAARRLVVARWRYAGPKSRRLPHTPAAGRAEAAIGLAYRRPLLQARALSETPPMRRCDIPTGPSPHVRRVATVVASIAAARHHRGCLTQPE